MLKWSYIYSIIYNVHGFTFKVSGSWRESPQVYLVIAAIPYNCCISLAYIISVFSRLFTRQILTFVLKNWEKSAVKYSTEKTILLNFLSFSTIVCPRLHLLAGLLIREAGRNREEGMLYWKRILQLIGKLHWVNEWVLIFLRAIVLKTYIHFVCFRKCFR